MTKHTRRFWTDADRAALMAGYADPTLTRTDVAKRLGRTLKSVKHEAKRLNLVKATEIRPTPPARSKAFPMAPCVTDWHAHAAELRRRGIGEATVRAMLASVAR